MFTAAGKPTLQARDFRNPHLQARNFRNPSQQAHLRAITSSPKQPFGFFTALFS